MIARGRIVRGVDPPPVARVVPREIVDAKEQAAATLAAAERDAQAVRERARAEGREQAAAELAAAFALLRHEQAARDEKDLERSIDLARVMAERLLGEALRLEPERIVAIARQALSQVRKARRITIAAHPDDAAVLSREIAALGLESTAVRIQIDPARPRGSLLLATELGSLDADLSLQLDRLTKALRDGLAT